MENLVINKTTVSPYISFNVTSCRCEIIGNCRPEHPTDFFKPVFNWLHNLEKHLVEKKTTLPINFVINLEYINSVSIKILFDLFKILERIYLNSKSITIEWHYKNGDSDMKEAGEEYQSIFKTPFKLIAED